MEADRREWVPLRQVGWAFLLAWVFCVFYTNAAGVLSDGTGSAATGVVVVLGDVDAHGKRAGH